MLLAISSNNSIFQLFTVFFIFIFVLVITYFVTKWIATFQKEQYVHKNFEVIESFRFANGKDIQIIRVTSKYYAVLVCKDSITVLDELDKNEISFEKKEVEDFKEILNKIQRKILKNIENNSPKEK